MDLNIPYQLQMFINYLLKRFPKTEWSGPAWYKLEEDEWNLVHFIPIDLGSSGATEFKGKALLKVMKEVQRNTDIKGCFQGIIHSHHGMGAFHSGTDDTELEEGANKVGYPSLVVAHTGTTHAFKHSYEDQFGHTHLEKGDISVEMPEKKPKEIWVIQADKIEKAAKRKPKMHVYTNANQSKLWGNGIQRYNGWGHQVDTDTVKYNEAYEKMENAKKLYSQSKMSNKKFEKAEEEWRDFEDSFYGVI